MKIAVCDNNAMCINTIQTYLNTISKSHIECDVYFCGEKLISAYRMDAKRYDVIFIDIKMEKLNGIETVNLIRELDEHVIIVIITGNTEYMQKSFKCAPFLFLIKPVDFEEFRTVFYDICQKLSKRRKVFTFNENKAKIRLYCDDIIYCESKDHWTWIYTKEKHYKIYKSLTDIYGLLDQEMLYRVHKSFIINFLYIKYIKGNMVTLYHCDKTIPISRSYRKKILEEYTDFIERNLYV